MSLPPLHIRVSKLCPDAVWVARTGSGAWGLETPTSDTDVTAVVVESPSQCMGLAAPLKVDNRRTAAEGETSGPDDLDVTVYGLRHFAAQLAKCNPNVLTALFSAPAVSPLVDLAGLRPLVRSQLIVKTHVGMAEGMMKPLTGWDWGASPGEDSDLSARKSAVHVSCAIEQALQILSTSDVRRPLSGTALGEWLQSLRDGHVPADQWLSWAERMLELLQAKDVDHLPEIPNRDRISNQLIVIHRAWWNKATGGWI